MLKVAVAAAVFGLGVLPAQALDQQFWSGRFPLPVGGRVAVENVHGSIRVEGWNRAEVEVIALKTTSGAGDLTGRTQVAVERGQASLTFRTLYLGASEEPVRVDYRLRVPRQARLETLRTVEGDILVRNIQGYAAAQSLHGNIWQFDIAGGVTARTLEGNITVSLRALPEVGTPVELDTVNGDVNLILPSGPDAEMEVRTVAGRVEGEHLFVAGDAPGDNSWRVRLGHGGVRIRLQTIRGSIRVSEREGSL